MHWTERLLNWLHLLGPIKVDPEEMQNKYDEYERLAEEERNGNVDE